MNYVFSISALLLLFLSGIYSQALKKPELKELCVMGGKYCQRSFLRSAQVGDLDHIIDYIKAGGPIHSQDKYGRTALHYAAWDNQIEVAEILINAKIDVNIRDDYDNIALYYAMQEDHVDMIQLLIDSGSDPVIHKEENYDDSTSFFQKLFNKLRGQEHSY